MYKKITLRDEVGYGFMTHEGSEVSRFKFVVSERGKLYTDIDADNSIISKSSEEEVRYYFDQLPDKYFGYLESPNSFFQKDGKIFTISSVLGNKVQTSYVIYSDGSVDSMVWIDIDSMELASQKVIDGYIKRSVLFNRQLLLN